MSMSQAFGKVYISIPLKKQVSTVYKCREIIYFFNISKRNFLHHEFLQVINVFFVEPKKKKKPKINQVWSHEVHRRIYVANISCIPLTERKHKVGNSFLNVQFVFVQKAKINFERMV